MTELRVRDVGTGHSPLIGLVGRLSSNGNQGSHPGPLSFWALAPIHRLLGGSAWSLMVGVVALNTAAVALTLWVALRRGGAALAVGFAAGFAVLVHLYGTHVLTEPWNPYMPVMWWPLTLVAVWAVLDDDLAMLPVAVFAGSFCMQTHISYLGIVAGIAALAVAGLALRAWRLRDDRPARRRLAAWSGAALALGLVLWLPPVIDQVINDPGNASVVLDHFLEAEDEPDRRRPRCRAVRGPPRPLAPRRGRGAISGSVVPGLLLVAVWAAAAVATWRMTPGPGDAGSRTKLLRLHVVVAAALVLGLVSAVRILGFVWHYLLLWGWGTTTLTLVAVGWTACWRPAGRARRPAGSPPAPVALAVVVLVGWTAVFAAGSRDARAHAAPGVRGGG